MKLKKTFEESKSDYTWLNRKCLLLNTPEEKRIIEKADKHIMSLSADCTKTELELIDAPFSDYDSPTLFMECLSNNNSLKSLTILCDEDSRFICAAFKALEKNTTLTSLHLRYKTNVFFSSSDPYIDVLCEALKINSTLTSLNLSYTRLTAERAKLIADTLNHNKAIINIDISGNCKIEPVTISLITLYLELNIEYADRLANFIYDNHRILVQGREGSLKDLHLAKETVLDSFKDLNVEEKQIESADLYIPPPPSSPSNYFYQFFKISHDHLREILKEKFADHLSPNVIASVAIDIVKNFIAANFFKLGMVCKELANTNVLTMVSTDILDKILYDLPLPPQAFKAENTIEIIGDPDSSN